MSKPNLQLKFTRSSKKVLLLAEKLPRAMAQRSFLTILAFFLLALLCGSFVFFKYVYLVKNKEIVSPNNSFQFDDRAYQRILLEWQKRNIRILETETKQYPNPF